MIERCRKIYWLRKALHSATLIRQEGLTRQWNIIWYDITLTKMRCHLFFIIIVEGDDYSNEYDKKINNDWTVHFVVMYRYSIIWVDIILFDIYECLPDSINVLAWRRKRWLLNLMIRFSSNVQINIWKIHFSSFVL
jgi:hypothetical protein